MNEPLLELRDVNAGYGPFRAIFDVSFQIFEGSVVGVIGSNGAGKTTIARVCTGLVKPTSGRLLLDGDDVTGRRPFKIARHGVVHAPEGRSVFTSLTVEENLRLTFHQQVGRAGQQAALEHAYELFPRLGERRRQEAGTLSGGEQRMLSLARVLAEPPRLLIVDELSLGLAPIVVDEVYRLLASIRDAGTALLIIEQHVHHVLELADDVIVLNHGRIAFHGPVRELGDLSEHLLPAGRHDASRNGQTS